MEEKDTPVWGCNTINPKYCKSCIFAHGKPPFADAPEKANCMIYSDEKGMTKPVNVYYDGAPCEYYNDGKDKES